jgi:hypothetical protein
MSMSKTSTIPRGIMNDINNDPSEKSSDTLFGFNSNNDDYNESSNKSSYTKSTYFRIGMIIVILLFLGINIFSHLGDFFQHLKDTTAPIIESILKNLGYVVTETTKDVTELTATGAKLGVDVAAGTVESGIDVIQGQLDIDESQSSQNNDSSKNIKSIKRKSMSKSLSNALANAESNSEPLPDDATSSTQRNGSSKTGYCYIGEDRGFRSCISVEDSDVCMSGDIFPSNKICVNPSLRE